MSNFLANLGLRLGHLESQACLFLVVDEPECPKCLTK